MQTYTSYDVHSLLEKQGFTVGGVNRLISEAKTNNQQIQIVPGKWIIWIKEIKAFAVPVYWVSPVESKCEFCGTPIKNKFYDARIKTNTVNGAIAGIACPTCFTLDGCGLGTGKGQEYSKQKDGRWLKIGG